MAEPSHSLGFDWCFLCSHMNHGLAILKAMWLPLVLLLVESHFLLSPNILTYWKILIKEYQIEIPVYMISPFSQFRNLPTDILTVFYCAWFFLKIKKEMIDFSMDDWRTGSFAEIISLWSSKAETFHGIPSFKECASSYFCIQCHSHYFLYNAGIILRIKLFVSKGLLLI